MNRLVCIAIAALSLAAAPPSRNPLPTGALARLGHARMKFGDFDLNLVVSADGKWITGHGQWFHLADGREKPAPVRIPNGYSLDRFFSDGSYAVRGEDGWLVLAPDADRPRAKLPHPLYAPSFDRRGRFCVTSRGDKKNYEIVLADLRLGGKIAWRTLASSADEPSRPELSADGACVLWLEPRRQLCVYDVAAAKLHRFTPKEGEAIGGCAISPDGKLVATCDGRAVRLYDARTARLLRTVADVKCGNALGCEFSPDGQCVLMLPMRRAA